MHCKGHQKDNTDQEIGNKLTDSEAGKAAEKGKVMTALIPDGKLQIPNSDLEPDKYSKEDKKLINHLEGNEGKDGWFYVPDGRIIVPPHLLWKLVLDEHKKTHWGTDTLYKQLNQKLVS